jgi:hypothetical protein
MTAHIVRALVVLAAGGATVAALALSAVLLVLRILGDDTPKDRWL